MSKSILRDSVKVPSMTVGFTDKRINVFIYELIKKNAFQSAFELIISKAYYNLDFFLDGSLPHDSRIGSTQSETSNSNTNLAIEEKIDSLSEIVLNLNMLQLQNSKALEESNASINQLLDTINNLASKNNELVSTLSEMQESMKNTEQGLQVLEELKTSGINVAKVIEENKPTPEMMTPVKEAQKKPTTAPAVKKEPAESTSNPDKSEISSVLSGGLFSNINFGGESQDDAGSDGGLDINSIIAKMRGGN